MGFPFHRSQGSNNDNNDISILLRAISNGKIIETSKNCNENINDNSNFSGIFNVIKVVNKQKILKIN